MKKRFVILLVLAVALSLLLSGCVLRTNEVSKFCKEWADEEKCYLFQCYDYPFESHGDCVSTLMEDAEVPDPNNEPAVFCNRLAEKGWLEYGGWSNVGECVSHFRP